MILKTHKKKFNVYNNVNCLYNAPSQLLLQRTCLEFNLSLNFSLKNNYFCANKLQN